jgi:hypothetical protein
MIDLEEKIKLIEIGVISQSEKPSKIINELYDDFKNALQINDRIVNKDIDEKETQSIIDESIRKVNLQVIFGGKS